MENDQKAETPVSKIDTTLLKIVLAGMTGFVAGYACAFLRK